MAETLSGLGDASAAGAAAVSSAASETGTRRLSDLRVIDLRAELKKRNLDSSGNKSVADCVEEEEEATLPEGLADSTELVEGDLKGLPEQLQEHAIDDKDTVNNVDTSSSDFTMLEENSGDGQEDVETSLENLQDMDMMDISVLDEADIDNGSVADCVEAVLPQEELLVAM